MNPAADPVAILRSRNYLRLLVLAAIIAVPIAALAYGFLALVNHLQQWIFTDLPSGLGFDGAPRWWPLLPLPVAGVLVGLTIRSLPGHGGESPADGFKAGGELPSPRILPGITLAALGTLGLGVVLGPEAPLIAIGGGLAIGAVRLGRRALDAQTSLVVAASGSFAAISALLGSPLTGAFLMMEASGLGGATMELVLVPGLLASGIGMLVFVGLDNWTGLHPASLAVANVPHFGTPTVAEFGWAIVIGLAAAPLAWAIRWLALTLRPHVERRLLPAMVVVGGMIAALAIGYAQATGHSTADVLFSGEAGLGPLVSNGAGYSVGALVLLIACKGLAYSASLSSFRGGPTFPAMYIGAAAGIALSHLPGLPLIAGVAMGIGAMCVAMLRLPLVSVLLASLLLSAAGIALLPLVIVAVVVAHVTSAWLIPGHLPVVTVEQASPAETPRGAVSSSGV
jgi:H+/Cl- antiporter ClcA